MSGSIRAFTVLELLVAMAITLVLAGLLATVTTGTLALWARHETGQVRAVAAKQALDLLERDLQAALHRPDDRCWLAVDLLDSTAGLANHGWLFGPGRFKPANSGSLRPLPPTQSDGTPAIADARFGLSGAWLRFVTTNVESGGGLPIVVSYQIARRPVTGDPVAGNAAPVRYGLYRAAISVAETFQSGYDVTAAAYGSASNSPSSALSSAYRQSRNVTNPSHANLLAANVVDFGCWLYRRDAQGGLVRIFPVNANDVSHHASGGNVNDPARYPDVADVMVRVLDESGAAMIDEVERGNVTRPPGYASDAEWWWSVAEANSQVFIRRIEIKAGAE